MDNLALECFKKFIKLNRKILPGARKHLQELGFAWNQYAVMKNIQPGESLTLSQISKRALKINSNVTALVDFLEQKGIVMRVSDPDDRRVIRVKLTNEGKRIRSEIIKKHEEYLADLFAALSDSQKKEFINITDIVADALKARTKNQTR